MTPPLEKRLYTAVAAATSGRDGRIKSDDARLDLPIAAPKALGGSGEGTNPEQLFAAGYAACFGSAMALVARKMEMKTGPMNVTAKVTLGSVGFSYGLAVELVASVPELSREQGEALIRAAHEVCPYSKATRGNIDVTLSLAA